MSRNNYEVEQIDDTYVLYKLKDARTNSSVTVCPERGAIATSCMLHGEELFYFDRPTFLDPQANIRGGNPILFPICGQLVDGKYEWEGRSYTMRNHGVARNRPWEVVSTKTDGEASLTVRLRSNESTLVEFPFAFELLFTYALVDGELQIRQTYSNLSDRSMPFYAGFHPYFRTENKNVVYATDATKYLDYNDNVVKPIEGIITLDGLKESVALLDATDRSIAFPRPGIGTIKLTYSEAFNYVVLWQVNGSPFICVEPWMALNSALNTRDGLPELEAGGKLDLTFAIGFMK
ncbi:aldose epimerase [Paenibacillus sp. R14(2021)]|uniref:aldose epimerase family protein n=1 Tax=Paenibacillus sp. R14(2021) TaxID=2859228 RepID=UPI001C6144AF|nr:aldose epimerase [Paenibacillus sp. R14(2021)]